MEKHHVKKIVKDSYAKVAESGCGCFPQINQKYSKNLTEYFEREERCSSQMVLLKELSEMHKNNHDLISSCIGGAILKKEYLKLMKDVGFEVKLLSEDKEISNRQYKGFL